MSGDNEDHVEEDVIEDYASDPDEPEEDADDRLLRMLAEIYDAGWCCDPKDPELIEWQHARLTEALVPVTQGETPCERHSLNPCPLCGVS